MIFAPYSKMECVWQSSFYRYVLMVFLWAPSVFAETPLENPVYLNQYEINSETVYFSDTKLMQSDLRLLVGKKFNFLGENNLRLGVGAYGLYQDSEMSDYSYRQGPMAQAKYSLWKNWLFLVYEYHYFTQKNEEGHLHENRYGLYGGYYYEIDAQSVLDIYAETFYIPRISDKHLLSTGRASIYWHTHFLIEVYAKDSPEDWGGSRTDVRVGIRFQPWDFISAKFFVPVVSSEDDAGGDWQGQINIYKVGDF